MATTGAVGGSQIDVLGLVSQLVAADRAPAETQITRDYDARSRRRSLRSAH